jgi:hypothetical protein
MHPDLPVPHPRSPHPHHFHLSHEFDRLHHLASQGPLTLGHLADSLYSRGSALAALILCVPFLLPIPIPGLSTIFGGLICLSGTATVFRKKPWIPKRWKNQPVPTATLVKIFSAGKKLSLKLEKIVRPRGRRFTGHPVVETVSAVMVVILGFLLALPLPPGTNFPPAISIILLSIGSLERDAVFVGAGIVAFGVNVLFFSEIFITAWTYLSRLLS